MVVPRHIARNTSPVPLEAIVDDRQEAHTSGVFSSPVQSRPGRSNHDLPNISTAGTAEPSDLEAPPQPSLTTREKDPVTWLSLPHKSQLAILFLARLSEPITQTSLQSYLYRQLASFEPDAPDSEISARVGFVIAAFPATQAITSVLWGLAADSPRVGRKLVIVIGLLGTAVGSVGYGLSLDWKTAMFWRAFSGILNGNVGVMRTMISEIIKEKKFQSRAFLLMPLCFNIGTVIGPLLGGRLSEPVQNFPGLFGPGSVFGGQEGVWWMQKWPFALPNFVSAVFLTFAAIFVVLSLDETLEALRDRKDYGRVIGQSLYRFISRIFGRRQDKHHKYTPLSNPEAPDTPSYQESFSSTSQPPSPTTTIQQKLHSQSTTPATATNKLPLSRMWTPNVLSNLLSRFLISLTVGTFQSLWITYLAAPRSTSTETPRSPLSFTGGLALPPDQIGTAMAILGSIGILLQLTLYPLLSSKLGTIRAFRYPLPLFPLVCALVPFLSTLPSSAAPPKPASGFLLWTSLVAVLAAYVVARTLVMPASAILVNNSSPHPSRLGTLHGVAQSIGSGARFIGPMVGGVVFGIGEGMGMVGLAWWVLAGIGVGSWAVSFRVREGNGHEVLMDGEGEESDRDGNRDRNG